MILLSFDTEEFDVPREHGVDFTLEQGMAVSKVGTNRILDVLKQNGVKATFFCTGNFAEQAPEVMQRIMDEGHEVACHGVDHWQPKETDFARSKEIVERVTGRTVYGYRQPRMFPVVESEIKRVGYLYNSSLNPALYAPYRASHLVYERRCDADSRFRHANHPLPAILAGPAQSARRSLSLDDAPRAEERRLLRHLFPSLGVLRVEGAPRVQDAVYYQEPQWPADVRSSRSSGKDASGLWP